MSAESDVAELPMAVGRAREIALGRKDGKLGEPTKMPGFAFGLSAFKCQRGEELSLDPNSTCAHCYARSNFYLTKNEVIEAHKRRLAGLTHPEWVAAMVTLIRHEVDPKDPYFRWHDSGDLQGVWHLANIVEVCRQTPNVHYWLPTHEPFMLREYLELVRAEAPLILPTGISADYIDCPPALIEGLERIPTSTAHRGHGNSRAVQVSERRKDSIECKSYVRAKKNGGAGLCGDCRACWNPEVVNVSYPMHGERAAKYQLPLFK
jgi:hypothetical protein